MVNTSVTACMAPSITIQKYTCVLLPNNDQKGKPPEQTVTLTLNHYKVPNVREACLALNMTFCLLLGHVRLDIKSECFKEMKK